MRVVEVNWLREVEGEDDVYETRRGGRGGRRFGWAIKLIYDPCSRVKEVT